MSVIDGLKKRIRERRNMRPPYCDEKYQDGRIAMADDIFEIIEELEAREGEG